MAVLKQAPETYDNPWNWTSTWAAGSNLFWRGNLNPTYGLFFSYPLFKQTNKNCCWGIGMYYCKNSTSVAFCSTRPPSLPSWLSSTLPWCQISAWAGSTATSLKYKFMDYSSLQYPPIKQTKSCCWGIGLYYCKNSTSVAFCSTRPPSPLPWPSSTSPWCWTSAWAGSTATSALATPVSSLQSCVCSLQSKIQRSGSVTTVILRGLSENGPTRSPLRAPVEPQRPQN